MEKLKVYKNKGIIYIMHELWKQLPMNIVNNILKYNGTISYRNGKYINKIQNIDDNYPLILERMRITSNRDYFHSSGNSSGYFSLWVRINIPNDDNKKILFYFASIIGLRIKQFIYDNDDYTNVKITTLYIQE